MKKLLFILCVFSGLTSLAQTTKDNGYYEAIKRGFIDTTAYTTVNLKDVIISDSKDNYYYKEQDWKVVEPKDWTLVTRWDKKYFKKD